MSKKPIIGGIILAAIIGVVFVGAEINPDNPENEKSPNSEVWNTRIAGPEYADISNHRYSPIPLERMIDYEFAFVPSGDSPERIQISVMGTQGRMNAFTQTFTLRKHWWILYFQNTTRGTIKETKNLWWPVSNIVRMKEFVILTLLLIGMEI